MNADEYWGRKCSMCKHFRYNRDPLMYVGTTTPDSEKLPLEPLCANRKENPISPLKSHNYLKLANVCDPYREVAPGCNDFDHPAQYKIEY